MRDSEQLRDQAAIAYSEEMSRIDGGPGTYQPRDFPDRAGVNAAVDVVVALLSQPDTWEGVAEAIGEHDYTYDLSDMSHRLDVVQIVLTTLGKAWR